MKARELIDPPAPGSPEWLKRMSASKIAAVVGTSPYESRFSLWHKMAGLIEPEPQTDSMSRGHFLEPAIIAWFKSQHPELLVSEGRAWVHPERDWQAATPDGIAYVIKDGPPHEYRLLECKSAADSEGWGAPLTDEIPAGYFDQVQWQLDVMGFDTAHVAMIGPFLNFAEYIVRADPVRQKYLRDAAKNFMDSLPGGPKEQRPDLDSHAETYQTAKALNPNIEDDDVEIPAELAQQFRAAKADLATAKANDSLACSHLADLMGNAKRATCAGETIATRRAGRNGGLPYIQATPIRKKTAA